MKHKKILIGISILLMAIIATIFLIFYLADSEESKFTEYTPQEEISSKQERQTLVTLYFKNKETKMLMPEARLIDAKLLVENPYATLVGLLINGPKNEKLQPIIPEGTRLNSVKVSGDMAIVDLSSEFINNIKLGAEEESKIVYSIVNTLVELTEINSVKFLIDGKENESFEDGAISFKDPFVRMD